MIEDLEIMKSTKKIENNFDFTEKDMKIFLLHFWTFYRSSPEKFLKFPQRKIFQRTFSLPENFFSHFRRFLAENALKKAIFRRLWHRGTLVHIETISFRKQKLTKTAKFEKN